MNTTHSNASGRRRRTMAATMMVAAGAVAAASLGSAATADAKPPIPRVPGAPTVPVGPANSTKYSAIVLSSSTGVWASWVNANSFDEANFGALNACQNAGGSQCVLTDFTTAGCVALAVDAVNWELWHTGKGPSVVSAQTAALKPSGGRIAAVACTNATGPNRAFTGRVNQLQDS
jgi:hypothetical protein